MPSLPVLSFTSIETDELNWNCELADWFWSFTELSLNCAELTRIADG